MAMDFISGPTTTTAPTTNMPRSPDSDTDTPPHLPPSKRAHHHHHHHHHTPTNSVDSVHVSYKECLKNHAASIGGHALDGCCEFMPGPTANPMDPTSLTCAACGCHRNFHRRDPDDPTPLHHLVPPSTVARKPHSPPSASQLLLSLSGHTHSPSAPSDHEIIHNPTAAAAAAAAASGGGVVVGYHNHNNNNGGSGGGQNGNFSQSSSSKKRFRTKFSQEQKERMYEFSEKIGWKLKKGEERLVEDFCKEVGVDRSVFKVWMHNNKHTSATPPIVSPPPPPKDKTIVDSGSIINHNINDNNNGICTTTTPATPATTATTATTATASSSSNLGGMSSSNCGGGVLASGIEFNFANGVGHHGQEAKAQ